MPARPRAPLGASQQGRWGAERLLRVGGAGAPGSGLQPLPHQLCGPGPASPGLSSEKERPCWAVEEAMLAGALSAHAAWSTQRSCGLEHSVLTLPGALSAHVAKSTQSSGGQEHSAFVWPGALSIHVAWSTQRPRCQEHSAFVWPGALSAHAAWSTQRSRGRAGSSSAPAGLRAPGPVSPQGEEGVEMGPAVPFECVSPPKMDRWWSPQPQSQNQGPAGTARRGGAAARLCPPWSLPHRGRGGRGVDSAAG